MPAVHQRKLIREAVRTALLNQTAAGDRVKTTRRIAWRPQDLPAISITTLVEPVEAESARSAPRELKRRMQLGIAATRQVTADTVDDDLDAIALEVERHIAKDDTLGGTCADCVLAGTEFEYDEQGDKATGTVILTFDVTYYTAHPDADDVTLVDLQTVDTKFTDLDGGDDIHASNQAEDLLDNLDV